jgi:hypothetical protein
MKQSMVSESLIGLLRPYQAHPGIRQLGKDHFLKKYFQFTSHVDFM